MITRRIGKKLITIHYPNVNNEDKKYQVHLASALNFFSVYDIKDLIAETLTAIKTNQPLYKKIKSLKTFTPQIRQFCMYCILKNSGSSFISQHQKYFDNIEREILSETKKVLKKEIENEKAPTVKKKSIQDNIASKANTAMSEIDYIIDEFIVNNKSFPTIASLFKKLNITAPMQNFFKSSYQSLVSELSSTEEDLIEAYSHLNKKQKKTLLTFIKELLEYFKQVKVIRAPRKKKPVLPAKLVKNIKLAQEGRWHGFTFKKKISPTEIINSEIIVLWLETKRKLIVMQALPDSKLTVSGSTIKNVDLKTSYSITLRHPEDVLSDDLQNIKKRALNNLTSQMRKTPLSTSRVNNSMFLINVIT